MSRIRGLDGLRGMAICMVVIYHYYALGISFAPGSTGAYAQKMFSLLWAGVDLFFVLSGFLIGGILIDQRRSSHYFSVFYLRRAARILPPYLLLIAGYLLFSQGFSMNAEAGRWLFANCPPVWNCLLFVQNIWMGLAGEHGGNWLGVTWSLAIEEQAYLFLPLLVRFLPERWLFPMVWILILSAPIFRVLVICGDAQHKLGAYVWPHCRWDGMAFGMLGALMIRSKGWEAYQEVVMRWWRQLLALAMAGMFALTLCNQNISSPGLALIGHTWFAASGLLLVFIGLKPPIRPVEITLTHPLLTWLGTISYGTYLFHQPISGLVHGWLREAPPAILNLNDLFVSFVALGATLVFAHFSWRLMESRIVNRARKVSYSG